jgi:hypothetical protein
MKTKEVDENADGGGIQERRVVGDDFECQEEQYESSSR